MIAWVVEDSASRQFVNDRRAVIRTAKARARKRGLPQFGWKLRVEDPTKQNIADFLNGVPREYAREEIIVVLVVLVDGDAE